MAQAALIAETIAGMKRAISRHHDSSDSDEPYLQPTNRGNKLKRKAHHPQEGPSTCSRGLKVYKKSIDHAGYKRGILRRNPKRYDEDGDELPSDESDEEADARAAEDNPYADIRLEDLLLPLTSAASLPHHPSLRIPYVSTILTEMTQQACDMVQRERKILSNARQLLTKFRGDETWIPCSLLCSESDEEMFNTEKLYKNVTCGRVSQYTNGSAARFAVNGNLDGDFVLDAHSSSKTGPTHESADEAINGIHEAATAASSATNETVTNSTLPPDSPLIAVTAEPSNNAMHELHDAEMAESNPTHISKHEISPDDPDEANQRHKKTLDMVWPEFSTRSHGRPEYTKDIEVQSTQIGGVPESNAAMSSSKRDNSTEEPGSAAGAEHDLVNHNTPPEAGDSKQEDGEADVDDDTNPRRAPRRMRTRAQAQAAFAPTPSSRAESPESWVPPEIHPLFMIPEPALPDKDFGLPPSEADDTRRVIMMYVQKQEEVVRGSEKMYEGLLEADRKRKTVLEWCKAEGHVGEMSDGEDWYDKEAWGLEDDLRKGHNDEDDDNANQGKKTRGRRA